MGRAERDTRLDGGEGVSILARSKKAQVQDRHEHGGLPDTIQLQPAKKEDRRSVSDFLKALAAWQDALARLARGGARDEEE